MCVRCLNSGWVLLGATTVAVSIVDGERGDLGSWLRSSSQRRVRGVVCGVRCEV